MRHAWAVRPLPTQRIVHIHKNDNPGRGGNCFPRQFVGITAAVKAFVVMADNRTSYVEKIQRLPILFSNRIDQTLRPMVVWASIACRSSSQSGPDL